MLVALAVAGSVAVVAHRFGLLTLGGAVAAAAVGAAALFAGAAWAILLLFFFISSTALSRWRAAERDRLLRPLVEKDGPRDAIQVLANGGVFAAAAVLSTRGDVFTWQAIAAGAIAAATSDTWSTEVGTVLGGTPRTIFGGQMVAPGTSGGVTVAGSVAALAGAFAVALVVSALSWQGAFYAVFAGGLAGSFIDSVLGNKVQERRWCPKCEQPTERRTHTCGTTSLHRGGIRGCDNDVVNLMSTIAGGLITWTLT
jgi:uncharacterized protein (TIGR00297 family)